jgi:carbon monoxide dehydrogenase subunit G
MRGEGRSRGIAAAIAAAVVAEVGGVTRVEYSASSSCRAARASSHLIV